MAKITGLNVPPSLAEQFDQYVSEKLPNAAGTVSVSRRRKSSKTLSSKSQRRIETELERCAAYIAERMGLKVPSIAYNDFFSAEVERLRQGVFLEDYWTNCTVQSNSFYRSAGNSVLDPSPPAYQYRDTNKKPSIVTYENGVLDAEPIRSNGSIMGDLWHDTDWVWRRIIFSLSAESPLSRQPPVVWQCTGTITANASNRGSRPMVSALMRAHFIAAQSDKTADLSPPVQPATSLYWRYPIPDAAVGNYSTAQQVRYMVPLNWRTEDNDAGTIARVLVKSGVRPMLGRGYNNNAVVTTSMDSDQVLWQVADMPKPGDYTVYVSQDTYVNGTYVYVLSIPELRWRSTMSQEVDSQTGIGGGSTKCDLLAFKLSVRLIDFVWATAGTGGFPASGYMCASDANATPLSVFADHLEFDQWQIPAGAPPAGFEITVTVNRYKLTKANVKTLIGSRQATFPMPTVTNRRALIISKE